MDHIAKCLPELNGKTSIEQMTPRELEWCISAYVDCHPGCRMGDLIAGDNPSVRKLERVRYTIKRMVKERDIETIKDGGAVLLFSYGFKH
jgi:hypothetical protein